VEAGRLVELDRVETSADGLSARRPGPTTLALAQRYVDRYVRVSDAEIMQGMEVLRRHEHIVAESAGAASVAVLLKHPPAGRKAVVIVSGANIAAGSFGI